MSRGQQAFLDHNAALSFTVFEEGSLGVKVDRLLLYPDKSHDGLKMQLQLDLSISNSSTQADQSRQLDL